MSQQIQPSIESIFENNKKWVSAKKDEDPAFFEKLAAGQTPDYL
jgi:carbonic anhydrase